MLRFLKDTAKRMDIRTFSHNFRSSESLWLPRCHRLTPSLMGRLALSVISPLLLDWFGRSLRFGFWRGSHFFWWFYCTFPCLVGGRGLSDFRELSFCHPCGSFIEDSSDQWAYILWIMIGSLTYLCLWFVCAICVTLHEYVCVFIWCVSSSAHTVTL